MNSDGVLVLFNRPEPETAAQGGWQESDAGILKEVQAVRDALQDLGLPARESGVLTLAELPAVLSDSGKSVVFNLVERLNGGECDFNQVPSLCRSFGRPCTGNDTDAMMLTFDKWLSKGRLREAGLLVPEAALWHPGEPAPELPAPPLIVKPVRADGSEGISADSVLRRSDPDRARQAAERVHEKFHQPALFEQYIEGRELNVSVMERGRAPQILPISEVDFSLFPPDWPHIMDYRTKWRPGVLGGIESPRRVPAPLDSGTKQRVEEAACKAWAAIGCRDYARVDFRLGQDGQLYILEVNANPDLSPLAGFPASLKAAGIPFPAFVAAMIGNAVYRDSATARSGQQSTPGSQRA